MYVISILRFSIIPRPPPSLSFYVVININKLYRNPPADLGVCLKAYQLYWCCETLDPKDLNVSEGEREREN